MLRRKNVVDSDVLVCMLFLCGRLRGCGVRGQIVRAATVAGFLAFASSSAALASTVSLGSLNPTATAQQTLTNTVGPVDDTFTFTLTTGAALTIGSGIPATLSSYFTNGEIALYSGTPGGSHSLITSTNYAYIGAPIDLFVASLSETLGPGPNYYVEVTGTDGKREGNLGITVSASTNAIPELSTWVMLVIGFAGLSYAGASKRKWPRLLAG